MCASGALKGLFSNNLLLFIQKCLIRGKQTDLMSRAIKYLGMLAILVSVASCTKKNDLAFTVNVTHEDYNTVQASFVRVAIDVNGEEVPLDFDVVANIGINETRSIAVSTEIEGDAADVDLLVMPVGSGTPYTVSAAGVTNGAVLEHTVGDGTITVY